MSLSGKEIHRGYDEWGVIRVIDDGNKRFLAFGDTDEQSCWLKSEPTVPQHEYTRAMLLVLLFCDPKRSLSLGLGAGALNSCLHASYPALKQDVVELRSGVIEAAYKYFQLSRSKRLSLHHMDAREYLMTVEARKVDILFADIYSEEGLDEQQLQPDFLHECRQRLKSTGWLVMNCWRDHRGTDTLQLLKSLFVDVRSCQTQSGNWVILAGAQHNTDTTKHLKAKARELGQVMGFSLNVPLSKLKKHS